ncbi:MAG: hypothetical protein GY835_27075 [bacterium]|nr:hypothetical protein [bacterium]
MTAPRRVHIVSHTHWDREWYLTYHEFRVNLLRNFRGVLDALERDPEFRHFVMDGQAIALEDYLEIHPEEGARLSRFTAEGKLSLGPWYILPDEFLVSDEAMVRNLLRGHQVCRRFGEPQKVGYMPDSFGHLAQIPQLLRGAEIDSFIYTRGHGDELAHLGHEYLWVAPDGSEVLAVNQCGGYDNAAGLGYDEYWHAHTRRNVSLERAVEQVGKLFEKMEEHSNGEVRLLSNGGDHLPAQRSFGAILAAVREAFPDTEFLHTGFAEFVDAVREEGAATRRHSGELLGGLTHFILSGVWSARMYLKQQNEECQNLLQNYFEPVSAAAHLLHGFDYPQGLLDYSWRLLMANHPHDSICGCSTDDVHREMVTRFAGVRETAEHHLSNTMDTLTHRFGRDRKGDRDTVITIFNPLPERRTEVVERVVVLQPPGYDLERLRLYDETGEQVPFTIAEKWYVERFWGIDYRAGLFSSKQREQLQVYLDHFGRRFLRDESERDTADCFLRIQFVARSLPGVGHASYFLRETDDEPALIMPTVGADGDTLENEFLLIKLHDNGCFDITDKRDGCVYRDLGLLEDSADIGDEYDYSAADPASTIYSTACTGTVRVLEDSGLVGILEAEFDLPLPRAIDSDRKRRSIETVNCRVQTRLLLRAGSPLLEIDTLFDNRAEDHRLRIEFTTDNASDTLVSDGHYYINERPLVPPTGEGWSQPHPGTYPQQDYSLLQFAEGGLAVLNRGLPEVAPLDNEGGSGLSLTLLRAVGWLSRDDFDSRNCGNAGPTIHTPDAQCPGEARYRYAVLPFAGDYGTAGIKSASQRWRVEPLTGQGCPDRMTAGGDDLLLAGGENVQVTAIKLQAERNTLVVRLCNLGAATVTETLTFGLDVKAAWRVNLLEERRGEIATPKTREIALEIRPHGIETVEVEFQTQADD